MEGMLSACARPPQGHRANSSSFSWLSKTEKGKMRGKCFGFPSVAGDFCCSCSTLPFISFIPPAFPSSGTRPGVCVTGAVTNPSLLWGAAAPPAQNSLFPHKTRTLSSLPACLNSFTPRKFQITSLWKDKWKLCQTWWRLKLSCDRECLPSWKICSSLAENSSYQENQRCGVPWKAWLIKGVFLTFSKVFLSHPFPWIIPSQGLHSRSKEWSGRCLAEFCVFHPTPVLKPSPGRSLKVWRVNLYFRRT